MMKLDPKIKTRWVNALHSGKYKQGREHLRDYDKYCCLGVLCDVVDPKGWSEDETGCLHRGESEFPMPTLVNVDFVEVRVEYDGHLYTFAELNDKQGLTFHEIADIIQEQL